MDAALSLARRGLGRVWPNPAVGCVMVARDGSGSQVVGRGWTQPGGRPACGDRGAGPRRRPGPRRHRLCHAGTLFAPWQDAALRRGADRRRRSPRGRGHRGPRSPGQRAWPGGAAGGRYRRSRSGTGAAEARELNAGLPDAHGAGPADGGAEAGHHAGRPDRPGQRRQPVDHRPEARQRGPPAARHP